MRVGEESANSEATMTDNPRTRGRVMKLGRSEREAQVWSQRTPHPYKEDHEGRSRSKVKVLLNYRVRVLFLLDCLRK